MSLIKSKWLVLVLLSLFLSSCAARKVNIDKVDSNVKIDSVSVSKKEIVTTQENNISIVTDTDELEIVPIDTTRAIVIDGKSYKNATLRYKKTKKVLVDTTKIKVTEKASVEVKVKKDISVKTFKKEIDKKSNSWWWIIIPLLIALGFYAYKIINKTLF
jgi:hypothetical protein